MKRIGKTIFAVLMAVVVLAGCTMKLDYGFVVGADKEVKVAYTIAYDKEFIDGMNSMGGDSQTEMTDEQRWASIDKSFENLPEGAVKEKVKDEGFYGYTVTMGLGKIDEVAKDSASERFSFIR